MKYLTRVIDIGYLRSYTLYVPARPHTMVLVFLLGTTTQGRLCLDLIHISRAPLHTRVTEGWVLLHATTKIKHLARIHIP